MYDYYEAVKEDVKQYIKDNADYYNYAKMSRDELEEELNDDLWTEDSVTGNGSGSYTFNSDKAFENLRGNLDLLADACEEFGSDMDILKSGAEACDVTIRCYLLSSIISEVLDKMYDNID